MANDPNRDLLPVKEESKSNKGFNHKLDYQILSKLSRSELEDRFLRLLDEQTHIKKLANSQEEKIKRLGTKLLRLINDKKSGRKSTDSAKETEDLHLRIIELEHENYSLKDRNTVLKQQLSSHSRTLSIQRSPNRSNHTSPLMTLRQSAPPTQRDIAYDSTNKSTTAEMQLQEAEAHIQELNDEIKSLHSKIDYLQQNLEKNSLDSRKTKVTENIELIRLQRSLKQQAIQIASLQAQVKNAENSQKLLKEELVKAHKENDEALNVISSKQNEILSLCSKLEEKNLNRLEEDELKGRINDLMTERDSLKERSDYLMKSLTSKTEESEKIQELEKKLAEEKAKREKLEEALELLKKISSQSSSSSSYSRDSQIVTVNEKTIKMNRGQQTVQTEKDIHYSPDLSEESECSCNKCNLFPSACKCSRGSFSNPDIESDTEPSENLNGKEEAHKRKSFEGKCIAEKMKLERELRYMREMLRSQTARCEAQQAEISRLMYELKMNEEKCNETLQKLDWHLKMFQNFEMSEFEALMRLRKEKAMEQVTEVPKPEPMPRKILPEPEPKKPSPPPRKEIEPEAVMEGPSSDKNFKPLQKDLSHISSKSVVKGSSMNVTFDRNLNRGWRSSSDVENSEESVLSRDFKEKILGTQKREETNQNTANLPERDYSKTIDPEPRPRFIDQKFLESSDEDGEKDDYKSPFKKKTDKYEETSPKAGKGKEDLNKFFENLSKETQSWNESDESFPVKLNEKEAVKDTKSDINPNEIRNVKVSIIWLKLDPDSQILKSKNIKMFFIDFSFLDINGAETETPESLPKPKHRDELCTFNFTQSIELDKHQRQQLRSLFKNMNSKVIVFQVVSDFENTKDSHVECEDFGTAVVTAKDFLRFCNKGPFKIQVYSLGEPKEMIGILSVALEASK